VIAINRDTHFRQNRSATDRQFIVASLRSVSQIWLANRENRFAIVACMCADMIHARWRAFTRDRGIGIIVTRASPRRLVF